MAPLTAHLLKILVDNYGKKEKSMKKYFFILWSLLGNNKILSLGNDSETPCWCDSCLTDVASDPGVEGRHPPAGLLLPRRRGRGRDHSERLVRARRYSFSSAPRPSAELPGSGEDNGGALWIQLVSESCHIAAACLPHGIPSVHTSGGGKQIYSTVLPGGRRQAVPSSIPAPSQHQSGGIDSPQR